MPRARGTLPDVTITVSQIRRALPRYTDPRSDRERGENERDTIEALQQVASVIEAIPVGAVSVSGSSVQLGTLVMQTSPTVTFGLSGSTLTASAAGGGGGGSMTVSAGTLSGARASLVFSNSNGVSFGMNGSTITASHNGLTSQSTGPSAISAGTTQATSGTVILSNANGVSFGLNGQTVTASIATSLSNINVSAGTTSNNLSALVFSNANGVSFGLNGSTVTASAAGEANALSLIIGPVWHNTGTASISMQTNTSGAMSLFPLDVAHQVGAEYLGIVVSMNMTTGGASSYRQTASLNWGLYTRPTGTASTELRLGGSSSLSWAMTYNNSSITVEQVTASNASGVYSSAQTNSAGLNLSSQYTGLKLLNLGLNSTLTEGRYWLGIHYRASTSSFNSGILLSLYGVNASLTGLAPMGSLSSAFTSGTNAALGIGGNFYDVAGSYTVAALTALTSAVSISQVSNNVAFLPYVRASTRIT